MVDPTFKVGMPFNNKDEFKEAYRQWGIKHRFQLYFLKNYKTRVRYKCFKQCGFFFIYATKFDTKDKDDNIFQLRSFNLKHKCGKVHKNFHLTSKLIAQRYLEEFRGDPAWSLDGIVGIVKKGMKLKIPK